VVAVAVDAGGADDTGVGGRVDESGVVGSVADGGDDDDVVVEGVPDGSFQVAVRFGVGEGEAQHGSAVVDRPTDSFGLSSCVADSAGRTMPYGEDGGVGGDAEGAAVGGDEAGHGGAVTVEVLEGVGSFEEAEVQAGEQSAGEVGVAAVDAGVDDADDDAFAGADLVDLVDVEEVQVPLLRADVVLDRLGR
jgi:hypothetical protein